jgi:hypothetical protein
MRGKDEGGIMKDEKFYVLKISRLIMKLTYLEV